MRLLPEADGMAISRAWARLGVMFNVEPARRTPDIEALILATSVASARNPRLLIMAATWLGCYGEYVAKRRLAVMAAHLEEQHKPVLGFMLDWVREHYPRHGRR